VTATGLAHVGLDLRAAATSEHVLRLVAEHAHDVASGPIWGHGWDETRWPRGRPPTTAELDVAVGNRPAYVSRVDVHSAVASTALRRLVPGLVAAPGYDGQGPLTADAHHLVRAVARDLLTPAQRRKAQRAALDLAARSGVVAVHECAGPDIGGLDDWQELRALGHGVEVVGYWGEAVSSADDALELVDRTGARGLAGDLFVDGAIGSHTAWVHEPYADAPGECGNTYLDADAVEAHLSACTQARITAGFHVIGDAAVTSVVDALSRVVERFGVAAVAGCGHRLEHLEMVTAEQAASLGSWGVVASVQPNFDAAWGGPDGMYAARLGPQRAVAMNPFATLASHGVLLAFGSDSPVTGMNPWATVRAAALHRTQGNAVSARAAFAAATRGSWRASGVRDGVTGTLAPGARASYAVWDVPGGVDALEVSAPADSLARWSTDPRSRVPALPRLSSEDPLPTCRQTVHRGVAIHG
jgi:predicted amidohydrolase YtcJ